MTAQIVRERILKRHRDDWWTSVSRRGQGSGPVRTLHTYLALLPRFADTAGARVAHQHTLRRLAQGG